MPSTSKIVALITVLAFTAWGCGEDTDTSTAEEPEAPSETTASEGEHSGDEHHNDDHEHDDDHAHGDHAHAAEGAAPGSHEDWCGEHAVPESLCTRCNGSLVAAFQATGDWCEEHGLPDSQCRTCNPELTIERPPPAGEAAHE